MQEENSKIVFDWKNILKVFGYLFGIAVFFVAMIYLISKLGGNIGKDQTKNMSSTTNTPQTLTIEDLVSGNGEEVKEGSSVSVHYVGTLIDGAKFDSSIDRGEPFSFTVGKGEVIKGWDQGLTGMKVGGKRKLTIPPDLGYGSEGAGDDIPPNSTLVFEIELLEIALP